jgi:hypothetical protein
LAALNHLTVPCSPLNSNAPKSFMRWRLATWKAICVLTCPARHKKKGRWVVARQPSGTCQKELKSNKRNKRLPHSGASCNPFCQPFSAPKRALCCLARIPAYSGGRRRLFVTLEQTVRLKSNKSLETQAFLWHLRGSESACASPSRLAVP